MSSKRQIRRRQCGHKRRYPDAATASAAANFLRRWTGERLTAYACPWCGQWHIGHPNRKQKQAMKARRGFV